MEYLFFENFASGLGLADFFDLREMVGFGVSLGFGSGVASSSSPVFFSKFDLCGRRDSFADVEVPVSSGDFSVTSFAFRIGCDSSGVGEAPCFFFDFFAVALPLAVGLGDLFGLGDEMARVSCCLEDSSR